MATALVAVAEDDLGTDEILQTLAYWQKRGTIRISLEDHSVYLPPSSEWNGMPVRSSSTERQRRTSADAFYSMRFPRSTRAHCRGGVDRHPQSNPHASHWCTFQPIESLVAKDNRVFFSHVKFLFTFIPRTTLVLYSAHTHTHIHTLIHRNFSIRTRRRRTEKLKERTKEKCELVHRQTLKTMEAKRKRITHSGARTKRGEKPLETIRVTVDRGEFERRRRKE